MAFQQETKHAYDIDTKIQTSLKAKYPITVDAGENVVMGSQETMGTNFEMADQSVRAIIVRKQDAEGSVRAFGKEIKKCGHLSE